MVRRRKAAKKPDDKKLIQNVKVHVVRLPFKDLSNQCAEITNPTSANATKMRLRNRKTRNYLEESSRLSEANEAAKPANSKPHVPVYLQDIKDVASEKRKSDLYEFSDDSGGKLAVKRKRRQKKSDDSFKVPKSVRARKRVVKEPRGFFQDGPKVHLKSFQPPKTNVVHKSVKFKNLVIPLERINEEVITKPSVNKVSALIEPVTQENKCPKIIKTVDVQKQTFDASHDTENFDESNVNPLSNTVRSVELDCSEFFGFSDENDSNQSLDKTVNNANTKTDKIKIVSNIVVRPLRASIASPSRFERPPANSTMLDESLTPWRANLPVKHNPHVLKVKPNALPNVDQDIILDSSVLERSMSHVSAIPTQKNLVQSVLSFAPEQTSHVNEPKDVSLFDTDKYSPIKIQRTSPEKPNDNRAKPTKRKILGEITHNVQSPRQDIQNDIEFCFGFSSVTEDKENTPCVVTQAKKSVELPTRVPFVRLVDIVKSAAIKNFVRDPPQEPEPYVSSDDEAEQSSFVDETQVSNEIKLFEDVSVKPSRRSYDRKFVKRRRNVVTVADDESDDEVDLKHRKKKRRDVRTEAEEREAEKWAKEFNNMCDEVDKYELEVE